MCKWVTVLLLLLLKLPFLNSACISNVILYTELGKIAMSMFYRWWSKKEKMVHEFWENISKKKNVVCFTLVAVCLQFWPMHGSNYTKTCKSFRAWRLTELIWNCCESYGSHQLWRLRISTTLNGETCFQLWSLSKIVLRMSDSAETSLGRKRLISWFYARTSSELGSDPHYLEIQTLRENNSKLKKKTICYVDTF